MPAPQPPPGMRVHRASPPRPTPRWPLPSRCKGPERSASVAAGLWIVAVSGCGAGEPYEPRVTIDPPTLDLGIARYDRAPPYAFFTLSNVGRDKLLMSPEPQADEGADLLVTDVAPFSELLPAQTRVIDVALDDRTWRWGTGTYDVDVVLEVAYFFTGQTPSEGTLPLTNTEPTVVRGRYLVNVAFEIDCDLDGDGFDAAGADGCGGDDCNDNDPDVSPAASEVCDGLDNDCDGAPDDGASDALTWYRDADSDGYGTDATTRTACRRPTPVSEWSDVSGDCNDAEPRSTPARLETCGDTIDNDCDGDIDEDC